MDIPFYVPSSISSLAIRTKSPYNHTECSETPSPTNLYSSRDSGYGSASCTPDKQLISNPFLDIGSSYTLDGSSPESLDSPVTDADRWPRSSLPLTPETKLLKLDPGSLGASSLRQPRTSRRNLPAVFFSKSLPRPIRRRVGRQSLSSPCLSSSFPSVSLRNPDRFVHPRESKCSTFSLEERFRLSKLPEELSALEKVMRQSQPSGDAFFDSTARFNPLPTFADERQIAMQQDGQPTQTRARTTLDPVYVDDLSAEYQPVHGSVWSVGTVPPAVGAVNNGLGQFTHTGTSAPLFVSDFVRPRRQNTKDENKHAGRLAAALDFDRASKLLQCNLNKGDSEPRRQAIPKMNDTKKTTWNGAIWTNDGTRKESKKETLGHDGQAVKILSAPKLRDDFYSSLLAFCPTTETIAVALADLLYIWSEEKGAVHLNGGKERDVWLTSLAFSSTEGGKSILAFGRSNSVFGLMALSEANHARIMVQEEASISCLSWRPTCTMRPSKNPNRPGKLAKTEDLLVGTDAGVVQYYIIEWPSKKQVKKDKWQGDITLVARISVHDQQVCGLAWAPDGTSFATGSNDNACCFFYSDDVLPRAYRPGGSGQPSEGQPRGSIYSDTAESRLTISLSDGSEVRERAKSGRFIRRVNYGTETWRWEHGAAVKAIAFCPWQEGLVATGGGSNDRCIHFFHTTSGAALAAIYVSAQVTGLMWSTTRREIAATFGFAHPSHSVRIAVYSWPDCKQVAAIPWEGKYRALYGIPCAKGPSSKKRQTKKNKKPRADGEPEHDKERALHEGIIAVASSEQNIRFYELWPAEKKPVAMGCVGMLGGSDILEDLQGIQKEGDIIR